ncbi:MAG TPA: hypothetical protein PLZ74_11195 [Kiritimatiellia bacterium]|nr:hypothetical protein [Kiritimatiellia bacterium]
MIENNPLPLQSKENLERMLLISRYIREVKRAIWDGETTSFLIAIPCALSSYNGMCHLLEGGWRLLCVFSLALSGSVCYDIAKLIIIQRVRRRWSYPQKSSLAEWERDAAKKFDDAEACTLTRYPRPIQIIIMTMVIPSVIASVLYGAFIYVADQDHPERIYLVIAAFALLDWYYRNDD